MQSKFSGYTFLGPFESAEELKKESGVYLVATDAGGTWTLLDCGEAGDVKSRVAIHLRRECWNKHAVGKIAFFVKYCEVKGRQMIAAEVRQDYQMPCG